MGDFIKTDEQYGDGIRLVEYKGEYYIHAAREGKDGNVYDNWAFPQGPNKTVKDTAVPVKVKLGSKDRAIEVLRGILSELDPDGATIPF